MQQNPGSKQIIRFLIMWPFLGIAQEYSFLDKSQKEQHTAKVHE
jgi:hypothetical protein